MTFFSHPLIRPDVIESRAYQETIAKLAFAEKKSLVVAPTALGKTVIAAMLTAMVLEESPQKKILILSPTKPLTVQHHTSFQKLLTLPENEFSCMTGSLSPEKRAKEWETARIICATPQTIENDWLSGRLNVHDLSLVVFDEAHRAMQDYSYVYLARQLQQKNPACRILALTASPGSDEEHIQQVCQNLGIHHLQVKNLHDADVSPYVNLIEVEWLRVDLPNDFLEVRRSIQSFASEQVQFFKTLGIGKALNPTMVRQKDLLELQQHIRRGLTQSGPKNPQFYQAASRLAALLKVQHAQLLLETQGIKPFQEYFNRLESDSQVAGAPKALKFLLADPHLMLARKNANLLEQSGLQHPKIPLLSNLLSKQFSENPDSRVLVFNHYRESTMELTRILSAIPHIRPQRFVGQAKRGEKDKGMNQKEQQSLLQSFRDGTFNVLVATSVAEEGLDIPEVDLVIFFEPVPSAIRSIQRRGRTARKKAGRCIILMTNKTRDEAYYWVSQRKEQSMKETLSDMSKNPRSMLKPADPTQPTLSSFSEPPPSEDIIIVCDHREQAGKVIKELGEKGAKISLKQLTVADFILSDRIAAERKSIPDFLQSMIDGRLFTQMTALKDAYELPLVILEGDLNELYNSRNIHENAIMGALSAVALDFRIPVLFTKDPKETAAMLFVIAKREQFGKTKEIKLQEGSKGFSLAQRQQFIVESLPLVGPTLAKSLLAQLGSVRNVMLASEEELQEVEKIGEKKAKEIRRVVDAKFEGEK